MSTLAQIRSQFYVTIGESPSNSHFSSAEADALANQALPLIAPVIKYPRKYDTGTQMVDGTRDYPYASDFISLVSAYFGDPTIKGDCLPMIITKEEIMKYLFPNWMDNHADTRDRPKYVLIKDNTNLRVFPTPNAGNSVSGKKMYQIYVYNPAALTVDGSVPDFPSIYHDCIQFYMAHLAYLGKLANADLAVLMMKKFDDIVARIATIANNESQDLLQFQWGYVDE